MPLVKTWEYIKYFSHKGTVSFCNTHKTILSYLSLFIFVSVINLSAFAIASDPR